MSEKELPPTQEKLRQARKKGQLAVGQDIVSLAKFGLVAEIAFFLEDTFFQYSQQMFDVAVSYVQKGRSAPFAVRLYGVVSSVVPIATIAIAFVLCAAASSWLATILQTKFNIAPESFKEAFQRLNPVNNLKQIFSIQKIAMLCIGPLKIATAIIAAGLDVWSTIPTVLQADRLESSGVWQVVVTALHNMERTALLVMMIWAIIDVGLQHWINFRNLKMSKEEIKQEHKNMEGDPHAKSFRRATSKEVLMSHGKQPKPSVVVVNPEHFAVALAYDFEPESIPIVVGKGVDDAALAWRDKARGERIPVIRYRTLARQLYATGRIGDYVPTQTLPAVALLFRAAMEMSQDFSLQVTDDALYEIDEEMACEILASATQVV